MPRSLTTGIPWLALLVGGIALAVQLREASSGAGRAPATEIAAVEEGLPGALEHLEARVAGLERRKVATIPVELRPPEDGGGVQDLADRIGNLETALQGLERRKQRAVDHAAAHVDVGRLWADLEELEASGSPDPAERIEASRRLLRGDPRSPRGGEVLRKMIGDYFSLQLWAAGLEALGSFDETASQLDGWEREKLRGVAYRGMGRWKDAEGCYERVMADAGAPELERAQAEFELAWSAAGRGDAQLAAQLYRGLAGRYGSSKDPALKGVADRSRSQLEAMGE